MPVVAEGTNVALTSVEICTGAGGQALGLHKAGFVHRAVVEIDPHACATLRANHPEWNVLEQDLLAEWDASAYAGVDLLAGGVPCPPFSKAGRQLGADDERDLFPRALDLAEVLQPKAVMLENVRGLLDPVFAEYREGVNQRLRDLGYEPSWRLLNASDYGVPQLRPRVILVAIRKGLREFEWPEPQKEPALTVGEALKDLMAANGWEGADRWAQRANTVAPTSLEGPRSMEARPRPNTRTASLACPRRRRQDHRGGVTRTWLRGGAAKVDRSDGGSAAGLSRRLGVRGTQDQCLPASRQRVSAARGGGCRKADQEGDQGTAEEAAALSRVTDCRGGRSSRSQREPAARGRRSP